MMKQYAEAKAACGDALLLFRMGDFYELFHGDAERAAKAVGLTLTSRDKSDNPIPMAGFPHHQLDSYLAKLIALGFRVAICEQVEDPKKAKGLVRREVTRVVTPGTLTDDSLLDPKEANYLAAVCVEEGQSDKRPARAGLAWVELSTGSFITMALEASQIPDELTRIGPAECLVPDQSSDWLQDLEQLVRSETMITRRPTWAFARDTAPQSLAKHFGTATLEGFGFQSATDEDNQDTVSLRAAAAVLDYLHETQKSSLSHIDRLIPYRRGNSLEIDLATRRSLELVRTMRDGGRQGSLLAVLDHTVTAMGSRRLAEWLNNPLTEISLIQQRLEAVDELFADPSLVDGLRSELQGVYDMQRLLARVTTGRASPRDLEFIGKTLKNLPKIKAQLTARRCQRLQQMEANLDLCPDLRERLESALVESSPLSSRDGGILREGYSPKLDSLRQLAVGGKEWIAKYQATETQQSGIPSLKVGYNRVFGYYLEVTNAHRDKVPENYIRKQTLKNAERYITPELKEYEEQVLSADEKSKELEYELFLELRDLVQSAASRLRSTADVLAQLDVLCSLAELARQRGYCRPQLVAESVLDITEGRHPVLDILEPQGTFVPNDTRANPHDGGILLITGPNMAGKSTYIRQVALITLMAQMGSFVPAREATIGVADRIFARVGAGDELARGQSTFMVEMTETARILNTATSRSLVILDEIGRGTSTYDGVSLAWAIVEHLNDHVKCRTLFATHYHELTQLEETLDGVVNLNVDVQEWEGKVVFLHRIVPGSADKSYGIHVAQLAGVPKSVNERAYQILSQLERNHHEAPATEIAPPPTVPAPKKRARPQRPTGAKLQLTLFEDFADHPLLDEIRTFDVETTAPLDALARIQQWQESLVGKTTRTRPR